MGELTLELVDMRKLCKKFDEAKRCDKNVHIGSNGRRSKQDIRILVKLGIGNRKKHGNVLIQEKVTARIAESRVFQVAITNERLKKFGLVSLLDQYQKVHI